MTYTSESESSEAIESLVPKVTAASYIASDDKKVILSNHALKKEHICDVKGCSAKFSRPWRLEAHKAVHLGLKPFPCDNEGCNKAYTSNYHLRRHKLSSHSGIKDQKLFRCDYVGCKKEFTLMQNVKKHYRRTHIEKTCKICGVNFFNHLQLKKHNRIHLVGYNLKCMECGLTFTHQEEFHRHKRGHRLHACPVRECPEVYHNWSLLRKHLATHPYAYVCMYCNKGYRLKKFLKNHILRHTNNEKTHQRKPYELKKVSCDICHIQLLGKGSLKRHIKNLHNSPKKEKSQQKKGRAPRKDKGIPKRSLAVLLSEVVVPKEVEKKLIESTEGLELIFMPNESAELHVGEIMLKEQFLEKPVESPSTGRQETTELPEIKIPSLRVPFKEVESIELLNKIPNELVNELQFSSF